MRARWMGMLGVVTGLLMSVARAAPAPPRDSAEGRVLYTRYCASCHGLAADGHGPVAAVLSRAPSDLRSLAAHDGTALALDRVARFVDGREEVAAHGSREMPVWGERFGPREPEGSGRRPAVDARIRAIVAYLATLQAPGH